MTPHITLVPTVPSVTSHMCTCSLVGVGFLTITLYVSVSFTINVAVTSIVSWPPWWIVEENGDRFRVGLPGCKEKKWKPRYYTKDKQVYHVCYHRSTSTRVQFTYSLGDSSVWWRHVLLEWERRPTQIDIHREAVVLSHRGRGRHFSVNQEREIFLAMVGYVIVWFLKKSPKFQKFHFKTMKKNPTLLQHFCVIHYNIRRKC